MNPDWYRPDAVVDSGDHLLDALIALDSTAGSPCYARAAAAFGAFYG